MLSVCFIIIPVNFLCPFFVVMSYEYLAEK